MARVGRRLVGVVALLLATAACGSGDEVPPGPLVDRIDEAVAAVEDYYEAPQDYFEVSATETVVSVIVAGDESVAEQAFWSPGDGLVAPVELGTMDRPTFRAEEIDFDPAAVLGQVRSELPDAEIVDFAVTGTAGGRVVYDARVQSAQGGVLLVLLSGDGRILGVQAE